MRRIIGWILTVVLSGAYSVLLSAALVVHMGDQEVVSGLTLLVPLVFAVLVMVGLLLSSVCRRMKWDSKGHGRAVLLLLLLGGLIWLTRDEPPIPDDFDEKDVICQDPAVLASYSTYMTFARDTDFLIDRDSKLPLSFDLPLQVADPLPMADQIEKTWREIAPVRDVIQRLDGYPGIADLTPATPLNFKVPVVSFRTWSRAAQVYALHALLRTAQGKPDEGARELLQLHRVIRKALPNNGTLVGKLINLRIADLDIQTAHRLANSPSATRGTLRLLADGFSPLTADEVSPRRAVVAEYVSARSYLLDDFRGSRFLEMFASDGGGPRELNLFQKLLSLALYRLGVQPNRTLRLKHRVTVLSLQEINRPDSQPSEADRFVAENASGVPVRNIGGQLFFTWTTPSFLRAIERAKTTQVRSDLLAMEIQRKLGGKLERTDPFTGKPYLVDQKTGEFYSPHQESGRSQAAGSSGIFLGH